MDTMARLSVAQQMAPEPAGGNSGQQGAEMTTPDLGTSSTDRRLYSEGSMSWPIEAQRV